MNMINSFLMKNIAAGSGNKIAVIDDMGSISYNDLFKTVSAITEIIPQINKIPPKSIIVCALQDSIESVICFLGLIYHGLIPCFVNPEANLAEMEFFIRGVNAQFALIDIDKIKKYENLLNNNNIDYCCIEKSFHSSLLQKHQLPPQKMQNTSLFATYTSGTSGNPSAIIHNNHDVIEMCQNYAKNILSIKHEDILLTTSNLFFAYGLNSLFMALYYGATAILAPIKKDPHYIFNIISRHKPSLFFGVPRIYAKLLRYHTDQQIDSIRLAISAGESLPQSLFKGWFERFGKYIIDGIGSTETLSTFITNVPNNPIAGCTGTIVPGFDCVIKDDNQQEIKNDDIGILWVKGPTLAKKYLNNAIATKERFIAEWFKTNDLFYKDKTGYFYYKGRAGDLIYKNGVWIFPDRVETRFKEQHHILDNVLIGEKTKDHDTNLILFVRIKKDCNLTWLREEIIKINEKNILFREEEKISFICIIKELQKTASGKIKRSSMQQLWSSQTKKLNLNQSESYYNLMDLRE
jgi:benzoate-CoA ligase